MTAHPEWDDEVGWSPADAISGITLPTGSGGEITLSMQEMRDAAVVKSPYAPKRRRRTKAA